MPDTYPPAREPTAEEWAIRRTFLDSGRSVPKTAFALGIERAEVIRAVMVCRWWLQDSGWDRRYTLAKSWGFGEEDCRLHADQEAAYNMRTR